MTAPTHTHRSLSLLLLGIIACAPASPRARTAQGPPVAEETGGGGTANRVMTPIAVPATPVSRAYAAALARGTRARDGRPGPRYWQQRVRYQIDATLDPRAATVRGRERIVYLNRSPNTLNAVVLNLYQNIFTPGVIRNRYVPTTRGITLERVEAADVILPDVSAQTTGFPGAPGYTVRGTLGRLTLPAPLAPGDSVVLEIDWRADIPPKNAFRTGWEDALGARVLQVAQWYPQVAVYDDVKGWDETPYLGEGEFYLEYGDFDVALTLPAGWTVGATGELTNPAQVLSPQTRQRLAAALASDSARPIVTAADLASGAALQRGAGGMLTWRFRARDVRDFAFATSDRYLWDAAGVTIPADDGADPRRVLVQSLYRSGAPGWERAVRYGQHAISYLSQRVLPYAYPQVTIAEGPIRGMEYPMLVFIARPAAAADLQSVIAHEVGHQWFPMMVGQDEAAFAWMDEGVNSFQEDVLRADFYPGSDPFSETRASYLRVAGGDAEVPLMRHTDLVSPYGARTIAAYTKPAVVLRALRGVLGDSVFWRALRTYARDWRFKHPQPWDFFKTFERVAGRELDWFWQPWFFTTTTFDQAIAAVQPVEGGVRVTVRNRGEIVMPAFVGITSAGGTRTQVEVPLEAWKGGVDTVTVEVPAAGTATRVELDPEHLLPDVDRGNNVWPAAAADAVDRGEARQ